MKTLKKVAFWSTSAGLWGLVLAVLVSPFLGGCAGGGGLATVPGLTDAGQQPGGSVNDGATGRVELSVDLSTLGLPATSRGGHPFMEYMFEVQLSYLEGAGASVYRQVPVDENGQASIVVDLKVGRWQLDSMAVRRDGAPVLVSSSNVVLFTVEAGQDTPVDVTLVPANGTATFTVNIAEPSPPSGEAARLISVAGENLAARETHRFTFDARAGMNIWGYIVRFRVEREQNEMPGTEMPPGLIDPVGEYRESGDDWQVYVGHLYSSYSSGPTVEWDSELRVRAGLQIEFDLGLTYLLDSRNFQQDFLGQPEERKKMIVSVFEAQQGPNGEMTNRVVEEHTYNIIW